MDHPEGIVIGIICAGLAYLCYRLFGFEIAVIMLLTSILTVVITNDNRHNG